MKSTALITGSTGGDLILVGQNEAKFLAQKKEVRRRKSRRNTKLQFKR